MRALGFAGAVLLCAAACGKSDGEATTADDSVGSATGGSESAAGSSSHAGSSNSDGGNGAPGGNGNNAGSGGNVATGGSNAAGGDSGGTASGSGGTDSGPFVPPKRPNIVVILNDDEGWNGTSVQMMGSRKDSKSDFYETPNMERLSQLGMTFSNGYAAPNCSPSRLSLLTGKTPARTKMTDIIERKSGTEYDGHPLLPPGHKDNPAGRIYAAPKTDQTIAELIKAHDPGYATAHFGKWHMNGGGPAAHGFDEGDGPTSNNEGQVGGDDPKLVFSLAEKASKFVRKNVAAKKPFYLQVSHYATHEESFALASTFATFQAKKPGTLHTDPLFAAMTKDLDTSIGRLLDTLADPNGDGDESDSLLSTTYILMLADNGAVDTISDNFPLNMGKASTWEGGVRVPFLLAGPGIAAGSRSDVAIAETDILPTIAEWVGATPPAADVIDGGSFAQLARGKSSLVTGRDNEFYFHFPHYQVEKGSKPMSSIRDGNLKLVHFYETGQDLLFDLAKDLEEQNDLAAAQPAVVKRLRRQLRDYLKSVDAPMPRLNPEFGAGTYPDVDQDGLDDDWEFRELLSASYGATDDPDGDGKDNLTEQKKQTDPL